MEIAENTILAIAIFWVLWQIVAIRDAAINGKGILEQENILKFEGSFKNGKIIEGVCQFLSPDSDVREIYVDFG